MDNSDILWSESSRRSCLFVYLAVVAVLHSVFSHFLAINRLSDWSQRLISATDLSDWSQRLIDWNTEAAYNVPSITLASKLERTKLYLLYLFLFIYCTCSEIHCHDHIVFGRHVQTLHNYHIGGGLEKLGHVVARAGFLANLGANFMNFFQVLLGACKKNMLW